MIPKQLAQKIADQIMADIEYNINVMDEAGCIIASGDSQRIGTCHQGAKKVMASGERNFIYEETLTEKKGINDPIFIDERCVGVVGISGDPDDVLKIKNVVNSLFYFLISREIEMSQQFSEKELKQHIMRKLIYQANSLTSEEKDYLKKHHFNYLEELYVVVCQGQLKLYTDNYFYYKKNDGLIVLLLPVKETLLQGGLEHVLPKVLKDSFWCGVTKIKQTVNKGYQKAKGTLQLAQLFQQPQGIYYYEDSMLFVNTLLDEQVMYEEVNPGMLLMKQDEMLYQTLLTFITCDGHMKETSNKLIIHRNTLLYRLNKIRDLTGYDPDTFKGLANLIYAILVLEKIETQKMPDKQ